jgi:hypothetical protein
MTCTVDGCYARTFRKNLCRNHFYMWSDHIPATASGSTERGLRATPTPTRPPASYGMPTYAGPCRCETPQPRFIPWFGGHECAACGMPIPS